MDISKSREGSKLTVAIGGSLDATTAFQFDHELMSSLDGVTELVLDLEKLDFIRRAACAARSAENHDQPGHDGSDQRIGRRHGHFYRHRLRGHADHPALNRARPVSGMRISC